VHRNSSVGAPSWAVAAATEAFFSTTAWTTSASDQEGPISTHCYEGTNATLKKCAGNEKAKRAKVPLQVLRNAQKAGGEQNVFKVPDDEDLWHIKCTFEDDVYRGMTRWVSELGDGDPPRRRSFRTSGRH
jgi:hypothetical protein